MLKVTLITLLFLIQTISSLGQSVVENFQSALDSAYYSDNLDDEEFYIKLATDLLNKIEVDKPYYQAKYYYTLAYTLSFEGQKAEVEVDETINKCDELLKNYQDSVLVYNVMLFKAQQLVEKRDYNNAFSAYLKILNIVRKKDNTEQEIEYFRSLEADCLNEIAYVHYGVHADEKAIEYYKKAEKLYLKIGNLEEIKSNYLYTGISYLELNDLENVKNCIALGDALGNVFTWEIDIADFMMLKSSYYLETGEIDSSYNYLNQAKAIYTDAEDDFGIVMSDINIAKICILNNEKRRAKSILEKSYEKMKNMPDRKALMRVLQLLSDLNFEFGNHQEANVLIKEAMSIQQELLRNAQVYFSYEAENKIELNEFFYKDSLNQISSKIKFNQIETQLAQKSWQIKLYTIVISGFAVLTTILIFLRRRNKKINLALNQTLADNQVLFQEVHHRVKNNFQITSSILNLQIANSEDEAFNAVLKETQHRIISMSFVHELLYKSDKVSEINIKEYIQELLPSVVRSFSDSNINIDLKIGTNDIFLNLEQSIPMGLILNEAITNSVKYAFPDRSAGLIEVNLVELSPTELVLTIRDNGIGMNYDEVKDLGTLGIELIEVLVEQIAGELQFRNNNGTEIEIKFKK